MTPAEELAAAADKLDALVAKATEGPWRSHDTHLNSGGHTATVMCGEGTGIDRVAWLPTFSDSPWGEARKVWGTSAYIAAMSPLVGKALAAVLRQWAKMIRLDPAFLRRVGGEETLAVARLINGSES